MRKSVAVAMMCVFVALPVAVQAADAAPAKGQMVVDANGRQLAPVYRVTETGDVHIIIESKLVSIPKDTLSAADGKLKTSLKKAEVVGAR